MNASEFIRRSREICEAATPGPWSIGYSDGSGRYDADDETFSLVAADEPVLHAKFCEKEGDATFIAAARTGWPRTLAALEEALGALEHARDGLSTAGDALAYCAEERCVPTTQEAHSCGAYLADVRDSIQRISALLSEKEGGL